MTKKFQEIVINVRHGGFGLSHEAILLYAKLNEHELTPATYDFDTKKYSPLVSPPNEDSLFPIIHYFIGKVDLETVDDKSPDIDTYSMKRDDPTLVKVVKKLKKKANGRFSELKVVRIPSKVKWEIQEYDGREWIAEQHRTWN